MAFHDADLKPSLVQVLQSLAVKITLQTSAAQLQQPPQSLKERRSLGGGAIYEAKRPPNDRLHVNKHRHVQRRDLRSANA